MGREGGRGTEKKMAEPYERGCGARPGLEARLCLCLSLIDFQRNCSRPPSSLMKPSGICWHPLHAARPGAAPRRATPRRSSLPPSSTATLSCCGARSAAYRRSIGDMHARWHAGAACPTRAAPRSAAAALHAHCSGFCLVAFLLYPQTKRRSSQARRAGIHLVLGCFFPARPHKPQAAACLGITAQSKAQSPETAPFPSFLLLNTTVSM